MKNIFQYVKCRSNDWQFVKWYNRNANIKQMDN